MGPAAGRVRNVLDDLVWTPVLIACQLVLFTKLECQVNFCRTQLKLLEKSKKYSLIGFVDVHDSQKLLCQTNQQFFPKKLINTTKNCILPEKRIHQKKSIQPRILQKKCRQCAIPYTCIAIISAIFLQFIDKNHYFDQKSLLWHKTNILSEACCLASVKLIN